MEVRPLPDGELVAAEALLDDTVAGRHQSRLGEMIDVLAHPALGAYDDGQLVGLTTWGGEPGADPEVAALAVAPHRRGMGVAAMLLEAVVQAATEAGSTAIWLVTTNDNLDALRLYQRHRFHLVELHAGAVDRAREVKPAIPAIGQHGIPLRDELVLERRLEP